MIYVMRPRRVLLIMGLREEEIRPITGHKTLQMYNRYIHLRAEDLVKKLQ